MRNRRRSDCRSPRRQMSLFFQFVLQAWTSFCRVSPLPLESPRFFFFFFFFLFYLVPRGCQSWRGPLQRFFCVRRNPTDHSSLPLFFGADRLSSPPLRRLCVRPRASRCTFWPHLPRNTCFFPSWGVFWQALAIRVFFHYTSEGDPCKRSTFPGVVGSQSPLRARCPPSERFRSLQAFLFLAGFTSIRAILSLPQPRRQFFFWPIPSLRCLTVLC